MRGGEGGPRRPGLLRRPEAGRRDLPFEAPGETLRFDGQDIASRVARLGMQVEESPCLPHRATRGFVADVTDLVKNACGTHHELAGFPHTSGLTVHGDLTQGVSLFVLYRDPSEPTRTVCIQDGTALVNHPEDFLDQAMPCPDRPSCATGFHPDGADADLYTHVGGGQCAAGFKGGIRAEWRADCGPTPPVAGPCPLRPPSPRCPAFPFPDNSTCADKQPTQPPWLGPFDGSACGRGSLVPDPTSYFDEDQDFHLAAAPPQLPRPAPGADRFRFRLDAWDSSGDCLSFTAFVVSATVDPGAVPACRAGGNTPPVCDAGGPYQVECGGQVQLDATGSWDCECATLAYAWSTDCAGATFDDPTSDRPVLTVPPSPACGTCRVSLTVTDALGKTSLRGGRWVTEPAASPCTASLEVRDTVPPWIPGIPWDRTVECDQVPPPPTVFATDNCDPAPACTVETVRTGSQCHGSITGIFTCTDSCGNQSTRTALLLTVQDTTAPILTGVPPDVTVECGHVPPPPTVIPMDNCDPSPSCSFGEVRTDGTCPEGYTLTRTWTCHDACDNGATATQRITVEDQRPPTVGPLQASPGPACTVTLDSSVSSACCPVVVHRVYRSTPSPVTPGPATLLAVFDALPCTDRVPNDGTYHYVVEAENSAGRTATNEASASVARCRGSCAFASLTARAMLLGVKDGGGALFTFAADPFAAEHHLNSVDDKRLINGTDAHRAAAGRARAECEAPGPSCPAPPFGGALRFYQAFSACGPAGSDEGPI